MASNRFHIPLVLSLLALAFLPATLAQTKPRARDLGVPFDGTPGPLNSVTDVAGVEVGYSTIIRGEGKLEVGKGPVRTGVTALFPRGRTSNDPVFAAWFSQNGNGEMTGTTWIEESGFLFGPVMITNTHSVGVVRDAVVAYSVKHNPPGAEDAWWALPVVAETWDGYLNDINGFHVKEPHTFEALDSAQGGRIAEGNVGGGTGMVCHEFKGGTGTASRAVKTRTGTYTLGVLVQCNYGLRRLFRVAGVPVGKEIHEGAFRGTTNPGAPEVGYIIVVVATDAPLLPHQLKRLTRRVSMGLARNGSISGDSSGDIFVAFSTANPKAMARQNVTLTMMPNPAMDGLFEATVQATEEAIINAVVAAETMTGVNGHTVLALPHDRLRAVLRKYNRLVEP